LIWRWSHIYMYKRNILSIYVYTVWHCDYMWLTMWWHGDSDSVTSSKSLILLFCQFSLSRRSRDTPVNEANLGSRDGPPCCYHVIDRRPFMGERHTIFCLRRAQIIHTAMTSARQTTWSRCYSRMPLRSAIFSTTVTRVGNVELIIVRSDILATQSAVLVTCRAGERRISNDVGGW